MYEIFLNGSLIYSTSRVELQRGIITKSFHLEIQKAGALEFTVHPSHPAYDEFRSLVSEVTVTDDGEEIFRGRVLSQSTTFYGERTVSCEGNLAYLNDSVLPSTDDVTESVESFFRRCISTHNSQVESWKQFEVGEITVEAKDQSVTFKKTGYQTVLSAIENELLKYYGGFLRTRHEGQTTYIDYIEDYDIYLSQPIQFSVNLLDLTEDTNPEEIYTIMVPVGKDNLTIESQNGGSNELVNETLVGIFGRIYKPESFSDIDDPYLLMTTAQAKMYRDMLSFVPKYSCKALDLHLMYPDLDKLLIGCNVHLTSDPQEIDVEAMILSADIDMQNPENNTYEIGIYSQDREERKTLSSQESGNAQSAADSNSKVAATSSKAASDAAKSITQVKYELDRTGEKITDNAKKISLIATDEELAKIQSGDIESIYSQSRLELEATQSALYTNAQKLTDTGVALMNAGVFNSITERKDESGKVIGYDVDSNLTASKIEVDTVGDKVDLTQSKLLEAGVFNHIDQDGTIHTELVARKALVDATADDIAATKRSLVEAGVYSDIDAQGNPSINTVASKLELGEVKNTADGAKEAADDAKDEVDLTKAKLLEAGVFSKINQDGSVETQLVARKSQVDATAEDIAATKQTLAEAGVYASLDAQGNPTIVNKVVSEDGVISAINNTTEGVIIDSAKVDLGKYATVSSLDATYLKTQNLSSAIGAITSLTIKNLRVSENATIVGDLTAASVKVPSGTADGSIDLAMHSHALTFENGQLTIGGAQVRYGKAEIGAVHSISVDGKKVADFIGSADVNFDRAKAVKEGADSVTLSSKGWATGGRNVVEASNGKTYTVELPELSASGGTTFTNHKTNVYISTPSVDGPLKTVEVDASSEYTAGKNSVTLSAAGWVDGNNVVSASNGKSVTVGLPSFSTSESNWASHKKTVYFYTDSVSGPLASVVIDAGSEYEAGVASGGGDVTISAAGWRGSSNVVTASNGKTLTINLPTFSSSQSGWSSHKKTVYFSTPSVDGALKTEVVDATSEYNAGANDVTISAAGWRNGSNVVSASNGMSVTVDLPYFSSSQSAWSNHQKTVYFSTPSVDGSLKTETVDATSEYEAGVISGGNDVTFSAAGWRGSSNVVSASNGKSLTINLPDFSSSQSGWSNHQKTFYFSTPSVDGALLSEIVDATSEYNAGLAAAVGRMVSGPTLYNVKQDNTNQKVTFDIGYRLNGQSDTTYVSKEVSASGIWSAGYNVGHYDGIQKGREQGANGISISSVNYETYYLEEEDVDVLKFTIKLSNGATKIYEINMDEMMIPEHGSGGGGSGTVDVMIGFDSHTITVSRTGTKPNYSYTANAEAVATYTVSDGRHGTKNSWATLDISYIYNDGYTDGYNAAGSNVRIWSEGWDNGRNVVSASNGSSVTVTLPEFSASQSNWSNHQKSVYFYTPSVSGPLKTETVDATSEYNAGRNDGRNSVGIDAEATAISGTPRYYRNQQTYYFDVYSETTAGSGGTAYGLELNVHDAWQHGYDDGKSQVWVSDTSYTIEENSDEHNKYIDLTITLNNGKKFTWQYNLD